MTKRFTLSSRPDFDETTNYDTGMAAYDSGVEYTYDVKDAHISVHLYHFKLFLQAQGYIVHEIASLDRDGEHKASSEEFV